MEKGTIIQLDEVELREVGQEEISFSPQEALALAMAMNLIKDDVRSSQNKKLLESQLQLLISHINAATVKKPPLF